MGSIISNIPKVRFVTIFCVFILLCMLSINTGQCRPERRLHNRQSHKRSQPTTPAPDEVTANQESSSYEVTTNKDTERQMEPCHKNLTTMELCQRCAKESKSNIVMPLCCSNEDSVQDWCEAYIYFGL